MDRELPRSGSGLQPNVAEAATLGTKEWIANYREAVRNFKTVHLK